MAVLIRLLIALSEGEELAAVSRIFGMNKSKIFRLIKGLTPNQEKSLSQRFGKHIVDRVKSSVGLKHNEDPIPETKLNSTWIDTISWIPKLNVLTLKVKNNKKIYKLPFFPARVAHAMLTNNSPGKTIWNGYWRVFGKGKVSNKAKNLVRVETTKKVVNLTNKLVPALRMSKKGVSTRVVKPFKIKTSNIKGTNSKGVRINIKPPKL